MLPIINNLSNAKYALMLQSSLIMDFDRKIDVSNSTSVLFKLQILLDFLQFTFNFVYAVIFFLRNTLYYLYIYVCVCMCSYDV